MCVFVFYVSVRGQENGLDGTKSGGPSGRGTERGRRGRGRGRGNQICLGLWYSLVLRCLPEINTWSTLIVDVSGKYK